MSLIQAIVTTGSQSRLFGILKGKMMKNNWYPSDIERGAIFH